MIDNVALISGISGLVLTLIHCWSLYVWTTTKKGQIERSIEATNDLQTELGGTDRDYPAWPVAVGLGRRESYETQPSKREAAD
jgi:hypothetical protein